MDYHTEHQLKALQGEKESVMNSLSSQQISLAKRLKNGLGEEIINELNNPTKPKKKDIIKYRIKYFFNKFKKKSKKDVF